MATVHIDPTFDDAARRERIFKGDVIIYTRVPEIGPSPSSHAT